MLAWADEKYDTDKLTVENFSKFYKETYINNLTEYEDFYITFTIDSFEINNFIIEGLPLNKRVRNMITLEQKVQVLVAKNKFNSQLQKFAEVIMDFWHYFRLETYYKNYRLVFKVNQVIFDEVFKNASLLEQKLETDNIISFFSPIVDFFNTTRNFKAYEFYFTNNFRINGSTYKINLINKTEKSFTVKLLRKVSNVKNYDRFDVPILMSFNSFYYGFLISPSKEEVIINNGEYSFLQIIEFQVD